MRPCLLVGLPHKLTKFLANKLALTQYNIIIINFIILPTCKIHLILSPGAIITVVHTPAKKPDVKIWKYLKHNTLIETDIV